MNNEHSIMREEARYVMKEVPARTEQIAINGIRMGIVQYGERSADCSLVLLHGFTGSAANWIDLVDSLVLPGMQVIALDMLGHGQSDAPGDPQRYAMEYCQADISAVLQALGVGRGKAILLGYSMGGRIALYSAFSGFFRALILESASPGLADPTEREQRRSSDEALAASIEREGVAAFVERWEQLPLFASQRALPAARREVLRAHRLQNRAQGLANSLRGVGTGVQPALHDCLAELDLPVLLLAGELDAKFCAIARQMEQRLPRAQLHIVAGAGHTVHLEQPQTFISLVREFCKSMGDLPGVF